MIGPGRIRAWLALLLLLSGLVPGAAAAQTAPPPRAPLGMNVAGLDDWSTELTFVDAFKTSRAWFSGGPGVWGDGRALDLDADGWVRSLQPGQIARTLMFWDLSPTPGRYPAGRYVVTYDGEGALAYAGGAIRIETAPGRDVLDVDPARRGGIGLFITATNPADYVRNIRVRMPLEAGADELFHPLFLERLRGFRTIRFQNWLLGQNRNNYTQGRWAERPRVSDARWSTNGAPVEVMVALANRLGADPWFTIPHRADDEYVRAFAQLVRQRLDPRLTVYVEHSNEVWNGFYPQAGYAQARGLELGLSQVPSEAQTRYHVLRSRQIFSLWEPIFPRERLVRVLGAFVLGAWGTAQTLAYQGAASQVDAVAIAPYFGVATADQPRVVGMSVDELLGELERTSLPQMRAATLASVDVARRFGVRLIAYEAGQHLVGTGPYQDDARINTLYDAANRHPRMGSLYARYLQDWHEATGGELMVTLGYVGAYGRFGRWGALEYLDQPRAAAPKYDALRRWIEGRPIQTTPDAAAASEGAATPIALGAFADPGSAGPWSVTVDWGDGTARTTFATAAPGPLGTQVHAYRESGAYTVTVKVADEQGASATATFGAVVADLPPAVAAIAGPAAPLPPGTDADVSAPFTDPGVRDTHTAVWSWGDGSTSAGTLIESGGSGRVTGRHGYLAPGTYVVSLTVTDREGAVGQSAPLTVVVG
jgi:hypothetical protein